MRKCRGHVRVERWKEHMLSLWQQVGVTYTVWKNLLQEQINTNVCAQTTMSLRPCRDWNGGLADSTNVQFLKIFLHQLCKKVQTKRMKDGLGVRIYNVWNYRLYVSWTSESWALPIHCLALNKQTNGWLMNHPLFKRKLAKICSEAYVWHSLF